MTPLYYFMKKIRCETDLVVYDFEIVAAKRQKSPYWSKFELRWWNLVVKHFTSISGMPCQPTDEKLDFYFSLLRPEVKQEVSSSRYEKVEWQSIHFNTLCDRKFTSVWLPSSTIFFPQKCWVLYKMFGLEQATRELRSLIIGPPGSLSCCLDIGHSLILSCKSAISMEYIKRNSSKKEVIKL